MIQKEINTNDKYPDDIKRYNSKFETILTPIESWIEDRIEDRR